jgi:hypothetical protein
VQGILKKSGAFSVYCKRGFLIAKFYLNYILLTKVEFHEYDIQDLYCFCNYWNKECLLLEWLRFLPRLNPFLDLKREHER